MDGDSRSVHSLCHERDHRWPVIAGRMLQSRMKPQRIGDQQGDALETAD